MKKIGYFPYPILTVKIIKNNLPCTHYVNKIQLQSNLCTFLFDLLLIFSNPVTYIEKNVCHMVSNQRLSQITA